MPEDAYKAAIELASGLPDSVRRWRCLPLTLTVKNVSEHTGSNPTSGLLALGNHWLDASGELDARAGRWTVTFTARGATRHAVARALTMRAPAEPGAYLGEIDAVHEGISWFAHKGSRPLRFKINVTRNSDAGPGSRAAIMKEFPIPQYPESVLPTSPVSGSELSAEAEFPMHGVPRDQVMALIREHGGQVKYLEEDRRAGPEWVSYRYFVVGRAT